MMAGKRIVGLKMTELNAPLYGAYLVNRLWVRNIIRFSDFDEYHLFASPADHETLQRDYVADKRVRVFTWYEIPRLLKATDYLAFQTFGVKACHLYALRDRLCARPCPICAMTHSLSYQEVLDYMLINMAVHKWPFDTFLCGTRTSRRAMVNIITRLREGRALAGTTLSPEQVRVVPHGIDRDGYGSMSQLECRRKLGLPTGCFVILSVGRLSFCDKIDYTCLIEAFARLHRRHHHQRDLLLYLAGDDKHGETRRIYGIAAACNVERHLRVFANFPETYRQVLYGAADTFVSVANSVQESFGITLLEAMAAGLPVIASDWNGYRDIIRDGQNGLLVKTAWRDTAGNTADCSPLLPWEMLNGMMAETVAIDPNDVARQMERVLLDADLRKSLRAAALRTARDYAWPKVVATLVAHWRSMHEISGRVSGVEPAGAWYAFDHREIFGHYVSQARTGGDSE
jgi:D-inositol-3-phosphate glycosyltransferase